MANPEMEIVALRQALQDLHAQYQQDIESLRQQLQQYQQQPQQLQQREIRELELSTDQILNRFSHVKTFTGQGSYTLMEFINGVENIISLCSNNEYLIRHGLIIIIKEKIQGEAKRCIQRLGENVTWDAVKMELRANFRPRKSYKKLMDECRSLKVSTPRELFDNFRVICNSLNELYEFDDNKPTNYSPENNNKNLVDVVKDMLTGSYRINITQNMSLIEVFNKFDDLDLLDETEVIHYSYRKNRNREVNGKESKRGNFKNSGNNNFQSYHRSNDSQPNSDYNNFKPNRYNNNFNRNNNNDKNNSQPNQYNHSNRTKNYNSKPTDGYNQKYSNYNTDNSGQFRQNTNSEQYRNFDNNSSGHTRQSNNKNSRQFKTRQNNFDDSEPMEVGNIQGDINFQEEPQEKPCP
ncbi:putative uncharacterized protein DDB_G0282499 [Hermetia illucens]|uniref:putative uncharacterized protein DDB_G0282499 n=1 Tax=Hermetia illucens TaxID=343691 RepID=UPI0018CC6E79|nr:putative uncharacterized protein DDB_G0282499 [Hermetia illucens]